MNYEEDIKDLEEIKMMFANESDGNYPACLDDAITAIYLLRRLEGFKYITTDVVLKEEQKLEHLDIYKTGWNDAIEAIKKASDRPLSEIIKTIKETEAREGYENDLA